MASSLADRVQRARGNGPGKALETQDRAVATTRTVLERMLPEFSRALPAHIPAEMFIRAGLTCAQKTPLLLDCTPESFLGALMSCAQLGLMPGTKEAALVPMGKTCTLIPQWQGLVKLMYNSGRVDSVIAEFIHANDDWYYVPSRRPPDDFHHAPSKEDRGEITHAYAFAWLAGGSRSRVALLTRDDAVYIRNRFSRVYAQAEANGKKNSFWHTDFDAAWRKSAVRRIADWVPTSAAMQWYLANEEDDGVTTTYTPPAPAVPAAQAPELEAAEEDVPRPGQDVAGVHSPTITGSGHPSPAKAAGKPGSDRDAGQGTAAGPYRAQAAGKPGSETTAARGTVPPDTAEGEFTDSEPHMQSSMSYAEKPEPAGAGERRAMFTLVQDIFGDIRRDDILTMLSGFTGRAVASSTDLTLADVADITAALSVAAAGGEGADQRFRDMCAFAAAGGTG